MKNIYMLMALMAGAAMPVQASINAEFAARGATTLWAAAISAVVTAITFSIIATVFLRIPTPLSPRSSRSRPGCGAAAFSARSCSAS